MLLSIGMMVKNEEKYLDKCLNALTPILNSLDSELIIVDTGSTDETVEIAKKYTDKVYFHKWNNNFSEMRNIVLSYCKSEWFFCIDGDEILENCDDIIDFFKSKLYMSYNSSAIYVKNLVDENDESKYSIFPSLRLFKKDKDFKFVNAVHNQPLYKEPKKTLSTVCAHYGYISTDKELMERKYERTAGILKSELEKNPENIYYLHQLSVSYGMHSEFRKAAETIQKAYDCIIKKKENMKNYLYVLHQLCICYFNIKNYDSVEKYGKETLEYDKNLIDIYYFLGVAYMQQGKDAEAVNAFESYLKLYADYYTSEKNISIINYTIDKIDDVYFDLFKLKENAEEYDEAQKYLLKIKSDKFNLSMNMVEMCVNAKEYGRLKKYEEELTLDNREDDMKKLYDSLEDVERLLNYKKETAISEVFSHGSTTYNILNKLRVSFKNDEAVDDSEVNSLLSNMDLAKQLYYYGDLIYYKIYNKNDISGLFGKLNYVKINEYLIYLSKKYTKFGEHVYDYILKFETNSDINSARINKELCRYLIILNDLEKDKLEHIYDYYLKTGIMYMKTIYSSFVFENTYWQGVRDEEEMFFVFMNKAQEYEETDKKAYFKYLKTALDVYPLMKNLVEYLLDKEKNKVSDAESEFESYKAQVKNTIKSLIANEKFEDAKSIINEYESVVPDDVETVLFKSQISLKKLKSASNSSSQKYKM